MMLRIRTTAAGNYVLEARSSDRRRWARIGGFIYTTREAAEKALREAKERIG